MNIVRQNPVILNFEDISKIPSEDIHCLHSKLHFIVILKSYKFSGIYFSIYNYTTEELLDRKVAAPV
jgi:hypothetical protein